MVTQAPCYNREIYVCLPSKVRYIEPSGKVYCNEEKIYACFLIEGLAKLRSGFLGSILNGGISWKPGRD
jgi:hypothetical protein